MAISLKKLFEPTLLTASNATIYTVDEATTTIIENLVVRLTNTTASPETVTGYAVPSGDSASTTNRIFNKAVPANDFTLVTVPTLKNGDFIQFAQSGGTTIVNIQHESGLTKTP
jgi:hypothetical protein